MIMTDFTPIQGVILFIAVAALVIDILVIVGDKKHWLLEVPMLFLIISHIAFYTWILIESPYDRNATFIPKQVLTLQTVMTAFGLALFRLTNKKVNGNGGDNLANIRNGFANTRDNLSNVRDKQYNKREHELDERKKNG